eukprot:365418-Chlamydomonas_euryale.AAC.9
MAGQQERVHCSRGDGAPASRAASATADAAPFTVFSAARWITDAHASWHLLTSNTQPHAAWLPLGGGAEGEEERRGEGEGSAVVHDEHRLAALQHLDVALKLCQLALHLLLADLRQEPTGKALRLVPMPMLMSSPQACAHAHEQPSSSRPRSRAALKNVPMPTSSAQACAHAHEQPSRMCRCPCP